jgi:CHAD domain-containing protein
VAENRKPNTYLYGANIIWQQLNELADQIEGAKEQSDIEHVHQLRVASRRIRSAMPLFNDFLELPESFQLEIRNLTKILGDARDLDVQIAQVETYREELTTKQLIPGIKRIILRLNQKRGKIQESVINELEAFETNKFIKKTHKSLTKLSDGQNSISYQSKPKLFKIAEKAIQEKLAHLLTFEDAIQDPANEAELHQMRIAGKQLRYTMETFRDIYPPEFDRFIRVMKKMQTILGDIHDCDVWKIMLPELLEEEKKRIMDFYGEIRPFNLIKPGVEAFREEKIRQRNTLFEEFLKEWNQWQQEGIWMDLIRFTEMQPIGIAQTPSQTSTPLDYENALRDN